jgi:hypothetical protein
MPVNLPPANVATPARGGSPQPVEAIAPAPTDDLDRIGPPPAAAEPRYPTGALLAWWNRQRDRVRARRKPADLALILVVAGAVVEIWRWALGRSLWLDEQYIAINIRDRGFDGLAGDLDLNQSAPLGWLWAERICLELFGAGERSLRLVPLLFGLGTFVVAWQIGRRWLGTVGTFALVALCVTAPPLLRYSAELKQYSADAFWVLALIGLAAWVVGHERPRWAYTRWWLAAAAAAWFSMAAIIVTPALALVLALVIRRRFGLAEATRAALVGLVWLASFGVHYALSLRHALGDQALTEYWKPIGFPPDGAGPGELLLWVLTRPATLARDPMELPAAVAVPLWALAGLGVLFAARRSLAYGALIALPVVMSLGLGAARLVPFSGRLVLWLVPVVFLGVAAGVAGLVALLPAWWRRGGAARVRASAAAAVALALAAWVAVATAGTAGRLIGSPGLVDQVDDRAAIAAILREYRPGDLVLVARPAKAAMLWYGGAATPDQIRYFSITVGGRHCPPKALRESLAGYRRVLAYTGHRIPGDPDTEAVIKARLNQIGTWSESRTYGDPGAAEPGVLHIVDLTRPGYPYRPAPALNQVANCVVLF